MLRVAVIGCGGISVMHLDSAAALPESQLVAVCDIVPEKAQAAAAKYGATPYTDYHELFEKEKPDVVHLCLPHYLHTVVAGEALNAGIHVISEKPMSIRYEDAVATAELAEQCGLQYSVIFQCRYNVPSEQVKARIEDGRLGKVNAARVVLTWCRQDEYYTSSDWKGTWEKEGGGVIINQAIHSLDLANWMINDGAPIEVQASLHNRNHPCMEVEDAAEGYIRYPNGATLSFFASNNYGRDEEIEIRLFCENGTVVMSSDKADICYRDGSTEVVDNVRQQAVAYSGGKDYWGHQHAIQIHQFYQAVLGREPLEITAREALKIQKIVCDIYANNDTPLNK